MAVAWAFLAPIVGVMGGLAIIPLLLWCLGQMDLLIYKKDGEQNTAKTE
jgi:hypothetical protein